MLLPVALGEAEFFGGLWLFAGIDAERTRPWAIAALVGVWASSLYQVFTGRCSSGWFGSSSPNPWLVLVIDLIALVALCRWRPAGTGGVTSSSGPNSVALGTTAILVAVMGISQRPLIVISGTARQSGHPLEGTTLVFQGNSVKLDVRTDHDGSFRLPPIRPGQYTVTTMIRASSADPRPNPPEPNRARQTTPRRNQRAARKARPETTSVPKPRRPPSAVARAYANTGIVLLDLDDCSMNPLIVNFD
jgi:hypothetical protein